MSSVLDLPLEKQKELAQQAKMSLEDWRVKEKKQIEQSRKTLAEIIDDKTPLTERQKKTFARLSKKMTNPI